jgi:putative holliday junction resolvase
LRLLGVDWGSKRIGVAVGVLEHGIATPRPNITPAGKLSSDAETIVKLALAEDAEKVVLGLPVEPSGQEGKMARLVRQLGSEIEKQMPVVYVDETLSSVEAETVMHDAGLKASERDRKRDAEAACRILERYLSQA